tara:strand:+ start:670 stop:813 length:144 start_codon:yes stop_codon:yes gene_type:complete
MYQGVRSVLDMAKKKYEMLGSQKCAGKNFPSLPITGWRKKKSAIDAA